MADDIQVSEGSGKTVATDDVGGKQYQRVKLDVGGDGVSSPVTDLATGAKQDTGNTSLSSINTKLTDNATQTTLATRLSESDFDTKTGSLTETAPATDTASSGLNGRLQRIAQRLTSLIAVLPGSLGQKTKANSLAVTIASDQDALPITDNSGSLTVDGTIAATQSGTWTVQPGNTANTTAWKVDGSAVTQPVSGTVTADTELPAAGALSDTLSNPTTPMVGASKLLWDGTGGQWRRAKEIVNGLNTTGTGLQGVGLVGQFDDVSPGTITENQFGPMRMSTRREAYTQIRDAAGNERGANVDASGNLNVALGANQSVNNVQLNGNTVSTGVGASGNGTQRVVEASDAGKTLVSTGGSAASSGNNTLVAAGTNKLKVYAFSLTTTSTTAVTCIFQSGASGTELWRVVLQAATNTSTGANLVVQPPAYLFATASATLLNLNLSGAQTVHWSVSYFDEA